MTAWLPEVEGWVKVAGAFVAVVMAILVPVRSWIVEDRRYRDQMLAAASARRDPTIGGEDQEEILILAAEVRELAAAFRDCAATLRGVKADRS
ncbi:hypothetical protein [Enterovirga rhinocerotis]|uniref:Uncharacterized protein n=1 Tax=Enterovirga rhinocerotis TaxID=1339210 RepID=A0A4V3DXJ9_9HYPH|nr:hypothetical protein [Enterovirga rhinocerotis]TDR88969.1 hypothetical protein EV668_3454 [Enterovirga rhinocerotis]